MNEKQAAMIGDLMKKPKFAMLQGLCSELGQAQENALNNKHKALHMQMITFSNQALNNLHNRHKSNGLGSSAPSGAPNASSNPGLGSSAPSTQSNDLGDTPPSSQSGGGEFDPANWDVAKNGVDYYVKTLYYLYDKLRTTESGNPNALLYFLEGLSKLSQYGGSKLLDQFTSGLCNQLSAFSDLFSKNKSNHSVPFSTQIAFALVTLAIYQAGKKGEGTAGVNAQIMDYINGPLAGSNPFLAQIKSTLNSIIHGGLAIPGDNSTYSLENIEGWISYHSASQEKNGIPIISTTFLKEVLHTLFGGTQSATDPNAIENSQAAVRQEFSEAILAKLNSMEKNGATIAELIDFVMMQYNLCSDDAGAYVGNIDDLSALEGDTSQLLGLFAPEKYVHNAADFNTEISDFMSHLGAYYRLTDMWPSTPNIAGGGEGSLEDILSGQLMDNLGSLLCGADVMARLHVKDAKGVITWRGLRFNVDASFSDLMKQFKHLFMSAPNSKQAKSAAQLMITIIQQRNSEPESTSGSDRIKKRNGALDSIVSSLQAVESQVSSANETAKSEYQQANQTSANMLSTGGDMMKDLMKMFSTSVQNEKAGV